MATTTPAPAGPGKDTVFRDYNSDQGEAYAQSRFDYHPRVYQTIIDYHTSTGGQLHTILDIGCGPGTAVRNLAPQFEKAIGLDHSEGMLKAARSLGGETSTLEPIQYETSTAEELGSNLTPPIPDGSIDLIVAAFAIHWFDMSAFWPRAAQVLKPGGSVAIWVSGNISVNRDMANSAAIYAAFQRFDERLVDYLSPGNRLVRGLLVDLVMPWTLAVPVPEFDKAVTLRKEWGTGPDSEPLNEFFKLNKPLNLDLIEKTMGTASPVTKWREAHPDAAGTDQDPVKMLRKEIEDSFREIGIEEGKETFAGGVEGVLLVLKKRA